MVEIPQKKDEQEKNNKKKPNNNIVPFSESFKTNVRYHRKQAITLWVSYYFQFVC